MRRDGRCGGSGRTVRVLREKESKASGQRPVGESASVRNQLTGTEAELIEGLGCPAPGGASGEGSDDEASTALVASELETGAGGASDKGVDAGEADSPGGGAAAVVVAGEGAAEEGAAAELSVGVGGRLAAAAAA